MLRPLQHLQKGADVLSEGSRQPIWGRLPWERGGENEFILMLATSCFNATSRFDSSLQSFCHSIALETFCVHCITIVGFSRQSFSGYLFFCSFFLSLLNRFKVWTIAKPTI